VGSVARVRGIYSTALTRILLEEGFGIAQPSVDVAERFRLKSGPARFELDVRDRPDRQGVESFGSPDAQELFITVLRRSLDDVVVRRRDAMSLEVEFPSDSKKRLDQVRGIVAPTVSRHHYLKACGGSVSAAVDMAERLLSRGRSLKETEQMLRATIEPEYPLEDSLVRIERVSLDGGVSSVAGTILSIEDTRLEVRIGDSPPELSKRLGIEEPIDHTVVRTDAEAWLADFVCCPASQNVQARLLCLITPPELYPYGCRSTPDEETHPVPSIRWVDLGVEIASKPTGQTEVTGMGRLEELSRIGVVTEVLVGNAREKLSSAVDSLDQGSSSQARGT